MGADARIHNPKFLSTPSARRATPSRCHLQKLFCISIHALCEEGDQTDTTLAMTLANFYPRPLRGGRPLVHDGILDPRNISIHALCEEGDLRFAQGVADCIGFLSTPSARRATYDGISLSK